MEIWLAKDWFSPPPICAAPSIDRLTARFCPALWESRNEVELSIRGVRLRFGRNCWKTTGSQREEAQRDVGNGDNSDAGDFYSGAVYGRVAGASEGVRGQ